MNLQLTSDPARLATLRSAWFKAITEHPGAYLSKRWAMMAFVLAGNLPYVRYPFHTGVDRNDLGVTLARSPLNVAGSGCWTRWARASSSVAGSTWWPAWW